MGEVTKLSAQHKRLSEGAKPGEAAKRANEMANVLVEHIDVEAKEKDVSPAQWMRIVSDDRSLEQVRISAIRALVEARYSPAIPLFIERLSPCGTDFTRALVMALGELRASEAVPALLRLLEIGARTGMDAALKWTIADALGDIGDAEALEALVVLCTDSEWGVRSSAAKAIGKIFSVNPNIPRGAKSNAIGALLKVLEDRHAAVRVYAVWSLGKSGARDENVIAALNEALMNGDNLVREYARDALKRLERK